MTDRTAFTLGRALSKRGSLLVARDDRISSPALAAALLGGAGDAARYLGIATTPSLYHALTHSDASYGVIITASHNPPEHNGLKVFDREGKLDKRESEALLEEMRRVTDETTYSTKTPSTREKDEYRAFLREAIGRLDGVRAVVDYGEGAACEYVDVLPSLGADIIPLHAGSDGANINVGCGALHPENLREEVLRRGAGLGIGLDGDGDRIVAVTSDGDLLDGDLILYTLALDRKARGTLRENKIAVTVMTNGGVLKGLADAGIEATLCPVGDAAVTAAMRAENLTLGGEQSGHVVLGDRLMTGDALLVGGTMLKMLKAGVPVIKPSVRLYPQCLLNVPVRDRSVAKSEELLRLTERIRLSLPSGRVLVRASGTEDLVRVMTECPSRELAERAAKEIADHLRLSK